MSSSPELAARKPFDSATLYVMSGTGNSRQAAEWSRARLEAAGVTTKVLPIDTSSRAAPADGLVGVFMPTHGFTAPWLVIKFAARMPSGRGAPLVCVATRASTKLGRFVTPGLSGTATLLVAALLALKGYRPRGLLGLDMPSNWLQVHPAFSAETVAFVQEKARPRVEAVIGRLLDGKRAIPPLGFIYDLVSGLAMLPISILYLLYGRLFFGKMFFASHKCDGCGLCEASCPAGGVKLVGKQTPRPYWNYHCESCNRCVSYCPRKAIEVGHGWATLLTLVSLVPFLPFVYARAPFWTRWFELPGGPWTGAALYAVFSYAALLAAYPLAYFALKLRPLNVVTTASAITHYWRRHKSPGTKLSDLVPAERLAAFRRANKGRKAEPAARRA